MGIAASSLDTANASDSLNTKKIINISLSLLNIVYSSVEPGATERTLVVAGFDDGIIEPYVYNYKDIKEDTIITEPKITSVRYGLRVGLSLPYITDLINKGRNTSASDLTSANNLEQIMDLYTYLSENISLIEIKNDMYITEIVKGYDYTILIPIKGTDLIVKTEGEGDVNIITNGLSVPYIQLPAIVNLAKTLESALTTEGALRMSQKLLNIVTECWKNVIKIDNEKYYIGVTPICITPSPRPGASFIGFTINNNPTMLKLIGNYKPAKNDIITAYFTSA